MTHHRIATTVEEGTIVMPPDADWPNGTKLWVEPVAEDRPTVWEVLEKYRGIAKNLPPDLAENHDHYIHGLPKK